MIDWEKSGAKEIQNRITSYITQYKKQPNWAVSGGLEVTQEIVDYYADGESIGSRVTTGGNISYGFAAIKAPFLEIPIAAGVGITPSAKIERLQGTFKLAFRYDESLNDPWVNPVSGSLSADAGISVGFELTAGLDKVAEIYVNGSIATSISIGAEFAHDGKRILLKKAFAKAGILKGRWSAGVMFIGNAKFDIFSGEGQWPEEESTELQWESGNETELYVIPESL